ncbi:MAG: SDR family NAD(P)-dependent oxidoreductase [Dongiaceae bacterium]
MTEVGAEPLPVTPSFRLDGRRALVTGAGRGLGIAFAAALAGAGAHVLLAARSANEVAAVAEAIRAAGGSAEPVPLDVTDVAAVRRAIEARPPCEILVNNAGTNRPKPMVEVSEADYDAVAGLNLRAAFFVAQAVASRLIAAGRPAASSMSARRWAMSAAPAARSTAPPSTASKG